MKVSPTEFIENSLAEEWTIINGIAKYDKPSPLEPLTTMTMISFKEIFDDRLSVDIIYNNHLITKTEIIDINGIYEPLTDQALHAKICDIYNYKLNHTVEY